MVQEGPTPDVTLTPEAVLPRLDAVRAIYQSANPYRGSTPWNRRWGLYQGASLGNSARDAYVRVLDGLLLPQVATRIEQRLSQEHGIPGQVALEQQMACGLGMCFCCVREFRVHGTVVHRRVCWDGPVFDLLEAVSW